MKSCHEFDTIITDYLMDECEPDTRQAVEEHLLVCADCRARFDERRGAAEALRALSAEAAGLSAERKETLLAEAQVVAGAGRARPFPWFHSVAAILLVGAIVGIVFVIESGSNGGQRTASRSATVATVADGAEVIVTEPKPADSTVSTNSRVSKEIMLQKPGNDPQVDNSGFVLTMSDEEAESGLPVDSLDLEISPDEMAAFYAGVRNGEDAPESIQFHGAEQPFRTDGKGVLAGDPDAPPVLIDGAFADGAPVTYTYQFKRTQEAQTKSYPGLSSPESGPGGGGGHQNINTVQAQNGKPAKKELTRKLGEVTVGGRTSGSSRSDIEKGAKAPTTELSAGSRSRGNDKGYSTGLQGRDEDVAAADPAKPATRYGLVSEDVDTRVRRYVNTLKRRPDEAPHMMFFRYWGDNPFIDCARDTQSTFGMDVDTASYTLTRNYLSKGMIPPKAAVRAEEFVNYIPSNYPAPTSGDFGLHVEMAPSRFSRQSDVFLMKVGIKAREVTEDARKPLALTFVIDVSGSMKQDDRLELVKDSIRILVSELDESDTVGIVVFESTARNILEHVSARELDTIAAALTPLRPGSSTNVQQGLDLGYAMALRAMNQSSRKNTMNRVVLFSDGVANTGQTEAEAILARVADCKDQGIFLNTFGVGMGNHNDHLLEQLADKGDGLCAYIDNRREAVRLFRKNLVGSFQTIAKDAKVQIDFDPSLVTSHRQIGYENRALAHRDFRNDAIDAGEVNAGHEVVALYEIQLRREAIDAVIFGQKSPAKIKVRYKQVGTGEVIELAQDAVGKGITDFNNASPRFRASAMAAAFADILRNSYWSRNVKLAEVEELAHSLVVLDNPEDSRISEMVALMKQASSLIDARLAQRSEYDKAIEQVKYNYYLRNRINDVRVKDARELQAKLEEENRKLEEELRKLIRE